MKKSHRPDDMPVCWEDVKIGTICYHIWAHDFRLKTGKASYFDLSTNTFHTLGKILSQHQTKKKNYIQCSYDVWFKYDIAKACNDWYKENDNA